MAEYINLEIERKVLKTLFWNKEILLKCISRNKIPEDIFSDKSFKIILSIIKKHFSNNGEMMTKTLLKNKVDRLKIKSKKKADTELYREKIHSVIDKFFNTKPNSKTIKNFQVYLEELNILRKARNLQKFNIDLFNNLDNSDIEEAEKLVANFRIDDDSGNVDQADITENFLERENYVIERKNNPDKYKLIPTGISDLDSAIEGGLDRELGFVTGSSNAGKSFYLQSVALNARKKGFNVILFTIEMQLLETQFRLDCNLAGIDFKFFRNPAKHYTEEIHKKWKTKIEELKDKPGNLEIVAFKKNARMSFIVNKIYEIMNKWQEPIHLVCIDYLDDIEPEKEHKEYKGWTTFGEISWDMHLMAKHFSNFDGTEGVPTWTATQMRKASKEVGTNSQDKKGNLQRRAPDERDVGSSPLMFRHADIFLGIQTIEVNEVSLLHLMKGRFTGKPQPLLCFHDFPKGRFHSESKKRKFLEANKDEVDELEKVKETVEMEEGEQNDTE